MSGDALSSLGKAMFDDVSWTKLNGERWEKRRKALGLCMILRPKAVIRTFEILWLEF